MKIPSEILYIINHLNKNGHSAFICGGAVRDFIIGTTPKDYDIATSACPDEIMKLFPVTIPLGLQFGVVGIPIKNTIIEVATFRSDISYSNGRKPDKIKFSTPEEDAQRRDFTINALFYDCQNHKIIDYTNGLNDIKSKIIRAVGSPRERFQEDYLRMLRAVRFATTLNFEIEPETAKAIKENAHYINNVSQERIRTEIEKIILSPNRVKGIKLLHETGLLKEILPEVEATINVQQPVEFHPEGDVFAHTLKVMENLPQNPPAELAWAALLHDIGKPVVQTNKNGKIQFIEHDKVGANMARKIMNRMKSPAKLRDTIAQLIEDHMKIINFPKMKEAKKKKFISTPHFHLLLQLHKADALGSNKDLSVVHAIEKYTENTPTELPPKLITGKDIIELGLKPGPIFRIILDLVFEAQLEGKITTKEDALRFVTKLIETY